jgi:hypothetical protein
MGGRCISPTYPSPRVADLGANYGADAEGTNVDRPRSGGFQDQARMGLLVLPCGAFWASGACGSVLGYHGRLLCFHGLSLILGFVFSVELGRRPCSLRMRLEGLAGGSCLFPSVAGRWLCLESSFSATNSSGRRYSQRHSLLCLKTTATTVASTGPKTGSLLIGAVQDQARFGCLVLHLGVSRASF